MKNINSIKNSTLASAIALSLTAFSAEAKPGKGVAAASIETQLPRLYAQENQIILSLKSLKEKKLKIVKDLIHLESMPKPILEREASASAEIIDKESFEFLMNAPQLLEKLTTPKSEEEFESKFQRIQSDFLHKLQKCDADKFKLLINGIRAYLEEFREIITGERAAEETLLTLRSSIKTEEKALQNQSIADLRKELETSMATIQKNFTASSTITDHSIHLEEEKIRQADNIIRKWPENLIEIFKSVTKITIPIKPVNITFSLGKDAVFSDQMIDKVFGSIMNAIHVHYAKTSTALEQLMARLEKTHLPEDTLKIESIIHMIQTQTKAVREAEGKLMDELRKLQDIRLEVTTAQKQKAAAKERIRELEDERTTEKRCMEEAMKDIRAPLEYSKKYKGMEFPSSSASVPTSIFREEWSACARYARNYADTRKIPDFVKEMKRSLGTGKKDEVDRH